MSEIRCICSSFGVHSVFTVCCRGAINCAISNFEGWFVCCHFSIVSSVCLESRLNKFENFKVPGKHYTYTLLDKRPTYINLKLSSKMFTFVLKHQFCVLSS